MKNEKCELKCRVFSRVVGYITEISAFNDGKIEEWKERVNWTI